MTVRGAEVDPVADRLRGLLAYDDEVGDRVRRVSGVVRILVALAVVIAAPLIDSATTPQTFGRTVGLLYVPAAGLLQFIQVRRPSRVIDLSALLVDNGFLLGVLIAFPQSLAVVLAAQLLVVSYYSYLCGSLCGLIAAAVSAAGFTLAEVWGYDLGFSGFTIAVYPWLLAGAALLLASVRAERVEMSAVVGHAREKAEAILTGVAEAVVVTSPRGRVQEWNAAAARTFDCPPERAVGFECAEAIGLRRDIGALDCSAGCALLRAQIEVIDGGDDLMVWRPTSSGDRQPLLAHAAPVLDDAGRVIEVVHSFRDITRLVQADEAKTLFLATASHELKTPLTVIMGYSELMLRQPGLTGDARIQGLKAIHERAGQLTGIVNRILMSSRIEAGRVDIEPKDCDVRPALEEAVSTIASALAREVHLDAPDEIPEVFADPDAVRTILDHLLDNAAKYSARDQTITVRVCTKGAEVAIEVIDRGVGLTAEGLEHCFDRFWQAESGDVRRFGGTGIGLYIVKSLVDALRGTAEVESVVGVGTTFRILLLRADHAASAPRPAPAAAAANEPQPSIIREFMRQVGVTGSGGI